MSLGRLQMQASETYSILKGSFRQQIRLSLKARYVWCKFRNLDSMLTNSKELYCSKILILYNSAILTYGLAGPLNLKIVSIGISFRGFFKKCFFYTFENDRQFVVGSKKITKLD